MYIYKNLNPNKVIVGDCVVRAVAMALHQGWKETYTTVTVPCGCCLSVSAEYVDATEDDATVTPTPSIFVRRYASLTVIRTA